MLTEVITKERLKIFYAHACYIKKLAIELEAFKANYNSLKGSNFAETKVMTGSKKLSPEELYLLCLESKSKKLERFTKFVEEERPIIAAQIQRLTNPDYKNILEDRYLDLKDWKIIALEYFGSEKDFWLYRETKYHFIVMTWHKRAVEALEEISKKPYIQANTQLYLEV